MAVLETAKIGMVSLANNHVLDYGYDALSDMLEILDRARIGHAGAGLDLAQASQSATAEICGRKLGLLAFTDNEPGWEVAADSAGTFYVPTELRDPRAQHLLEIVRRQKDLVDLLIVSGHWGSNWGYRPPAEHVAFAHALVDAGAGLVFGHSSHVFRGIEFYKTRPILYGAGDFVDDYAVDRIERNDEAFIYAAEIADPAPACLRLYPTAIRRCHSCRTRGIQARSIAEKMRNLCVELGAWASWDAAGGYLEVRASAPPGPPASSSETA
jgi:poly-gamma-glutamate capsule biosynthesis protein CapA/YwtB (metallophosphatase superfamily)